MIVREGTAFPLSTDSSVVAVLLLPRAYVAAAVPLPAIVDSAVILLPTIVVATATLQYVCCKCCRRSAALVPYDIG